MGSRAMESLSLRLRILLFFILIAVCGLISVSVGLWLAYRRSACGPDAFVIAAVISSCGIIGSVAAIWLLFDEHVATPVTRIASELRSRAHGGVSREIDTTVARYLGDLAPAAVAVSGKLGAENVAAAERIAAETARLSAERQRLAAALSQVPVGVILTSESFRITLYDAQASAALHDQGPLCVGHSLFESLDRDDLLAAASRLDASGVTDLQIDDANPDGDDPVDARQTLIRTADHTNQFSVSLSQLPDAGGYLLSLDMPQAVNASGSLVFDFSTPPPAHSDTQRLARLTDLTYVVFDLETTGLDPQQDDVVQLGAVRMIGNRRVAGEELDLLVNPGRPIPPASTRIHGITDAMVSAAPEFAAVASRFRRFAHDAVLVAHHAPFDLAFLHREAQRSGYAVNHAVLDTAKLSVLLFGAEAQHTLDALAERLEVRIPDALRHTALGDARATAEILEKMLPILAARGFDVLGDLVDASG